MKSLFRMKNLFGRKACSDKSSSPDMKFASSEDKFGSLDGESDSDGAAHASSR